MTIDSGTDPYGEIVVSEFGAPPPVTFTQGSCDTGVQTFVYDGSDTTTIEALEGPSEPIGWLPDGRLVFLQADRCADKPGKLAIYDDGTVEELSPEFDVGDAAVRAALPPPPKPPEERLPPAITA
jgi:hypothetical protein